MNSFLRKYSKMLINKIWRQYILEKVDIYQGEEMKLLGDSCEPKWDYVANLTSSVSESNHPG